MDLRPYKIHQDKERIELLGDEASFYVSFLIDKAAESFIRGLFLHQMFSLGDRIGKVDLVVSRIESMAPPYFNHTVRYRLLSPAMISVKRDYSIYAQYLSPKDPDYANCFINNLITKYKAHMVTYAGGLVEEVVKIEVLDFRLIGEPRKKGVVIKASTERETKVIGYLFDFELTAPVELHEIGYYAGFGEKNGIGFGCGGVR